MTDSRDEHETYGHTESPIVVALQNQIARLTAERDEARRCLCECLANGVSDATLGEWFNDDGRHLLARDIATERGWDCFHA